MNLEIIFGLLTSMVVGSVLYHEWVRSVIGRELRSIWLRIDAIHDEIKIRNRELLTLINKESEISLQFGKEIENMKSTDQMLLAKVNMAIDIGHRANLEMIKMYKSPRSPLSSLRPKRIDDSKKLLQKVKKQLGEF